MNSITRLIIKEWFKSLLGAVVVLFFMFSVADIVNGFLRDYESNRVVVEYVTKIPFVLGKLLPIAALVATLFSLNKLKTHAELMAILASGYSSLRIFSVIAISSLFLVLAQFANLSFLEPRLNSYKRQEIEKSRKNESKYLARSSIGKTGRLWYKTPEYFVSFNAFDKKKSLLQTPTIYYLNGKEIKKVVTGRIAQYLKPLTWEIHNATILNDLDVPNKYPVMQKDESIQIKLEEVPEDLNQFESDITTLNFFQLRDFIKRLEAAEISFIEYEIMLFEKIALSLACAAFALFPIFSLFSPSRRSSSFGKEVVYAILFTVAFWALYSASLSFANSGDIAPSIAALGIPVMLIITISVIFIRKRKL